MQLCQYVCPVGFSLYVPENVFLGGLRMKMWKYCVLTPKRHYPAWIRVCWCIACQNRFNALAARSVERFCVQRKKYKQELSYRKQIARQLRTQFVEGISVTLKSRLRVTQGHWKRNHWTDHTRLTIKRVIGRWILSWPRNVGQRSLKVIESSAIRKLGCSFLFAFYSNYGRICSRLWDIQCQRMAWPWKPG